MGKLRAINAQDKPLSLPRRRLHALQTLQPLQRELQTSAIYSCSVAFRTIGGRKLRAAMHNGANGPSDCSSDGKGGA